jgi:HEAT repeat protein
MRLVGLRLVAALALLAANGVMPLFVSQAQRWSLPVKVSNVAIQSTGNRTIVLIEADGSLSTAQNWQDNEGFHLVLPHTVAANLLKTGRGVKARRVGTSLEVLLQTRPGAKVSVQSMDRQLQLVVDGNLDPRTTDSDYYSDSASPEETQLFEDSQYSNRGRHDVTPMRLSPPPEDSIANSRRAGAVTSQPSSGSSVGSENAPGPSQINANQLIPQDGTSAPEASAADIQIQPEDEGFLASIFSGTSVLIVTAVGLFGLLVTRKLRSGQPVVVHTSQTWSSEDDGPDHARFGGTSQSRDSRDVDGNTSLVTVGGSSSASTSSRQSMSRLQSVGPPSLYGAYRIDQEVGKLILGQAHRIDVLASRATDDRRAIETSLVRCVNSLELDDNARNRAREALEEYGFVARQCATLLLSPDAFERTTAARSLGEIKSPSALPFLLEGLYDPESIVRNQAVMSIGELKLPSAIGALLDIARTHPNVPSALLSRTLSACSVEGLDFFDVLPEPATLCSGDVGSVINEITHLEPPSSVEDLPARSDDQRLVQALASLDSIDVETRSEALKVLTQFRVQSAVEAISRVARHDSEPNIRSMAISSLGSINHESVFPAVLIGMADDSREVRAAAARSLNRLSFDRADAYVRVIETSDDETIRNVAKACIQAGIVSQNLDRLSNSDHRQAYETFSLICLLDKAKMNEPILNAIADHPHIDVRLKAVHLLACTGQIETYDQLRELAVKDGMREDVKTALLEAIYKLDQARPKNQETIEGSVPTAEPPPFLTQAFLTVDAYVESEVELDSEQEIDPEFSDEVELFRDEMEF